MDNEIDPATVQKITRIVTEAGEERLTAYINQTFSPELVSLGYYTTENAATWFDIYQFMRWLSRTIQGAASSSLSIYILYPFRSLAGGIIHPNLLCQFSFIPHPVRSSTPQAKFLAYELFSASKFGRYSGLR
ncbi:hypothetical protein B0H13DRAFT_1863046 [Mycena leptocephala]|nr:hypothetical protein B0H13DRAFT_1863046 [Mycena leptocephala]